ncbi:MAG TPA: response regulator transcription factor [Verrucomicrobiales bacterium]|jgi:two-component system NarL family response regulator|nr:response regulator transcription factor [Verrucomicrobiales bacterium]
MSNKIRIVIVDDHPAIRLGLAAMLQGEPQFNVVAEAADVSVAVAACEQHQPDVVLMDLRIPGGGGVEATLTIRQRWPSVRVLVVTTYDRDEDIHRAVQAGASGYVLKGLTSAELVAAVKTVHSGGRVLPPAVATLLADRMSRKNLSPRELQIVRLIVNGRSNKEIANDLEIGEESVKTHLRALFVKLGVADRTQAAIEAIRHGIVHLD